MLDPKAMEDKYTLAPRLANGVERRFHICSLYAVCDAIAIDQLKRLSVLPSACAVVTEDANATVRCHP